MMWENMSGCRGRVCVFRGSHDVDSSKLRTHFQPGGTRGKHRGKHRAKGPRSRRAGTMQRDDRHESSWRSSQSQQLTPERSLCFTMLSSEKLSHILCLWSLWRPLQVISCTRKTLKSNQRLQIYKYDFLSAARAPGNHVQWKCFPVELTNILFDEKSAGSHPDSDSLNCQVATPGLKTEANIAKPKVAVPLMTT